MNKFLFFCRDNSLPLIVGVLAALLCANVWPEAYHTIVHTPIIGESINLHWLVNDVFMVFFFGIAGVEIVTSMEPGGALNPPKKAISPLMATVGGVIGPIIVYFILNALIGSPEYANGWGICTATDIALSWLIADLIFGGGHPAIKFLLLLAVVDDAIGLVIIAIFYPSPDKPFLPLWLILIPIAILIAYIMKKKNVRPCIAYILIPGLIAWIGLHQAGLHAALALIFIVPFMPRTHAVEHVDHYGVDDDEDHTSTLQRFEDIFEPIVDWGLFFFGFTAAGVEMSSISTLTLIVVLSLIIGKTMGIFGMTCLSKKLGVPLPDGMDLKDVLVLGVVGGIGLTVALFVCESAFVDATLISSAKMGALLSVLAAVVAFILNPIVRKGRKKKLIS